MNTKRSTQPDWAALRSQYVTSKISLKDLSAKRKVAFSTIQKRAGKERWNEARREMEDETAQKAHAALIDKRVEELVKFNEDDLRIATALKQRAAALLKATPNANDLRTIAATFEIARRMGLSALGVDDDGKLPSGEPGSDLPVSITIERKSARLPVASPQ